MLSGWKALGAQSNILTIILLEEDLSDY